MPTHDLIFQVTAKADAAAVAQALDTEQGIASWWTGNVELRGDDLRPAFPGMDRPFELTVARDLPHGLVWTVGEFPPFWEGTMCEWTIAGAPDGQGTRIDLAHRGFDPANPVIGTVTMEWAHILDHLVSYLETGVSDPRMAATAPQPA